MEYFRNDIVYIRDIGQGVFGRVFKVKVFNIIKDEYDCLVVVKMLKEDVFDELL